jgi:hypothetical protein
MRVEDERDWAYLGSRLRSAIAGLLVVASTAPALRAQQPNAGARLPVIDVHLHAYPGLPPASDPIWKAVPPGLSRTPLTSSEEHRRSTLREMDRYNIVLGVVSGPSDAVLRAWRDSAPDRFIGGSWVRVGSGPTPSVEAVRRSFGSGVVRVLGELNLQYEGIAPDDPRLEPYYALAEELSMPVGLHASLGPPGTPYFHEPRFRVGLGDPRLLEPVLLRHPKLQVYLMHAGHPYLESTKAIMYVYPQVYADLGVISWVLPRAEFYSYLKALVDAGFADRLMFGSDQVFWPEAIGIALAAVEAAPFLTETQKRDILYNNAARFLRLSDSQIAKHHGR